MKKKRIKRDLESNVRSMKNALDKALVDEENDLYNLYRMFDYLIAFNALKHNLGVGDCDDYQLIDQKLSNLFKSKIKKVRDLRKLRNEIAHVLDKKNKPDNFNDSIYEFQFGYKKYIITAIEILDAHIKEGGRK